MKLDRHLNADGQGKYALIKRRVMRELTPRIRQAANNALELLCECGMVDYGDSPHTDFFVIRIKDKYAGPALQAYANAAMLDGQEEYADEIFGLVKLANSYPSPKIPD